ncbi:hypothetical protein [Streptomyces achromogenes]|uniref:hypothetical protein n=1 Tax=Streptomyces achromogenes TaxID=67255 RepID=UPI0036F74389
MATALPGKAGDLAQWRDWQTPVLTGAGGTRSGAGAGCRLEHAGATTGSGSAAPAARGCGSP